MAEENATRRDWYEERSDGSLDFPYFLSAARRLDLEAELVGRLEKDSRGGTEAVTQGAREEGDREVIAVCDSADGSRERVGRRGSKKKGGEDCRERSKE